MPWFQHCSRQSLLDNGQRKKHGPIRDIQLGPALLFPFLVSSVYWSHTRRGHQQILPSHFTSAEQSKAYVEADGNIEILYEKLSE